MKYRILIVDDSARVRRQLFESYAALGHQPIAEASDGIEAIDQYLRFRPDLVSLDLVMPVLDGVGALQEILKINPKARVMLVSSSVDSEKGREAKSLGVRVFVQKPFNLKTLQEALLELERLEKVA